MKESFRSYFFPRQIKVKNFWQHLRQKFFFLIGLITLSAASAQAKTSLVVALTETDYPPFIIRSEEGLKGFSYELVTLIAENLDIKLSYKYFPWSRALHSLKYGQADLMIHLSKNEERENFLAYTSVSHVSEYIHLVSKHGKSFVYDGQLKQLNGKKVGVVRKAYYGQQFELDDAVNKHAFNNERVLVKELFNGTVDLIIGNRYSLLTHADRLGLAEQLDVIEPALLTEPAFIGFSKRLNEADKLALRFSSELAQLKKTAQYQNLLKKYHLN